MSDPARRAVKDLLDALGESMVLPGDLGELASDEEAAAFIRTVDRQKDVIDRWATVEVCKIFRFRFDCPEGVSREDEKMYARARFSEMTDEELDRSQVDQMTDTEPFLPGWAPPEEEESDGV